MPLFSYTARDAEGKSTRGTLEAMSAQAARDALREMGLQAEEIYEMQNSSSLQPLSPSPLSAITHDEILTDRMAMQDEPQQDHRGRATYFPLFDTLRLYAGWLLSWYFLIFAFGSYAYLRELPVDIPFAAGLFQSPVIISFAFGAFLFLLLTEVHKLSGKGKWTGVLLGLAWIAVFVLFRMNM